MNAEMLLSKYKKVCEDVGGEQEKIKGSIYSRIHDILRKYMSSHKRVAIYCNGFHTKMLMTDFISDIRDVLCVVDNGVESIGEGLPIIKDYEIESYSIDGVIISSFKHKDEIKNLMEKNHPYIDVLDIYKSLEEDNIFLSTEFYSTGPYRIYEDINAINNAIKNEKGNKLTNLRSLLKCYVQIKDFRMSIATAKLIYSISNDDNDKRLIIELSDIYATQVRIIKKTSTNNVVMLCLDGMRYSDFSGECMKKTSTVVKKRGKLFTNAYSYSTMTFESLIPAFSENSDQRTEYYKYDEVDADSCRFVKTAFEQKRNVYIYGDGFNYIASKRIKHTDNPQTITEKLWDFTVDLCSEKNGLFYIHELYESHFSFPNPYTNEKLIANGTAILFDFLPKNGGALQTDYCKQMKDSLMYIDDTLEFFVRSLACPLLLFADHGNLVLKKDSNIKNVNKMQLIASDDWIRIPLAIITDSISKGEDNALVSLMDLNDIMISLISKKPYEAKEKRRYIKIGRSAIYNLDFKELYEIMDVGYGGEAFEGFVFKDGYKLMVYSDGKKELFSANDILINDESELNLRYKMVSNEITVI